MFLRANKRVKDGKTHRYWSVVENRRVAGGGSVQKTLLYLGEINDSDRASWTRAIETVDERDRAQQIHLFAEDGKPSDQLAHPSLKLCLNRIELSRPRQWGGCWLAMKLWGRLDLDTFWLPRLPVCKLSEHFCIQPPFPRPPVRLNGSFRCLPQKANFLQ